MMTASWKKFLFWQLPGVALAQALVAQVVAFSLAGVPMWRDRPDELALAVLKDPANYRILLFGDSTTRNATVRFSLGAPGEIANLATNAFVGLSGSLFLLERYLTTHASPEHVVIAMGPRMYRYKVDPRIARYHLWYTFNRPDEREFLKAHIPGIAEHEWFPAILDLQERVVEPAISFLRQQYGALLKKDDFRIDVGVLNASEDAPVEYASRDESVLERMDVFAGERDLTMTALGAEVLNRVCDLSRIYGFRVNVVWSPVPAQLQTILTSSGALSGLETKIQSIMEGRCDYSTFADFNRIRVYPNLSFHNDMVHLYGDGWEQRYTADMRQFLGSLGHPIGGNAIEAVGAGPSLPDQPAAEPREISPRDNGQMQRGP